MDWIHSECVAWFVLQEFSVYSMVLLSPGHINVYYIILLIILGRKCCTLLLPLYTVVFLSYTVVHTQLNNIYTLTLLAGLTVISILLQIRHVFQCTQAEKL